ncbi:MAG: D-sedoheptulose 7-phosphate isomerase [Halothiobacillaceae bacterium]
MSFITQQIEQHLQAVSALRALAPSIEAIGEHLLVSLRCGGKLLLCGNGGSAADAQHIAAELVGRFSHQRRGLPALALTTDSSALTSIGNDFGFEHGFARQVEALARAGDILIGISTSGNSRNVIEAVKTARKLGVKTIGLLGGSGGVLKEWVDHTLIVPSHDTPRIQECHILVGHIWCAMIDEAFREDEA